MATVLRTPPLRALLPPFQSTTSSNSPKPLCVSFRRSDGTKFSPARASLRFSRLLSQRLVKFIPFASQGETETAETEEVLEPQLEDSSDGAVGVEDKTSDDADDGTSDDVDSDAEASPGSAIVASLQSYKEALASNDESKVAEIESFLKSIEDEKLGLERKVVSLSEELSAERDRVLRISADFENFRKRTDRERISMVTNAQGEVVESLLSVLDNFERAKAQIKVATEGEEKINNSYQSIYKQFMEILTSLGVVPVETVGKPFDPLGSYLVGSKFNRLLGELKQLHEAIMREESTEYQEGIIIQEFRKGFKLGDRLLRPSMVKVSAGPGPSKPEQDVSSEGQDESEIISKEGGPETLSS